MGNVIHTKLDQYLPPVDATINDINRMYERIIARIKRDYGYPFNDTSSFVDFTKDRFLMRTGYNTQVNRCAFIEMDHKIGWFHLILIAFEYNILLVVRRNNEFHYICKLGFEEQPWLYLDIGPGIQWYE
ncbi:MAG: hypothetical protein ACYCPT_08305 [Acidimicrobiales bacterium]